MTSNRVVAAAVALVASNLVIVGQAAWNRGAPPEATMALTERELRLPRTSDPEDTGLRLQFAAVGPVEIRRGEAAAWFDRAKLESLGFDCRMPLTHRDAREHYARQLARRAFVVLEFEGEPWKQRLDLAGERETAPAEGDREAARREALTATRLTVIDAGRDAAALRRQYPDRRRFLVAAATIRAHYLPAAPGRPARLAGRIAMVWPSTLHVPRRFVGLLAPLVAADRARERIEEPRGPRYEVTIVWGRRLEPWVADVRRLGETR